MIILENLIYHTFSLIFRAIEQKVRMGGILVSTFTKIHLIVLLIFVTKFAIVFRA